ncbi:hypothetical protein niasHT_024148 [Heterodera trifolii]|uniref:Uncharacterized protein n=1 Tax=Heterodera trifolii TaxID=157864 RepID=A0ABD2JLS9_9BILA
MGGGELRRVRVSPANSPSVGSLPLEFSFPYFPSRLNALSSAKLGHPFSFPIRPPKNGAVEKYTGVAEGDKRGRKRRTEGSKRGRDTQGRFTPRLFFSRRESVPILCDLKMSLGCLVIICVQCQSPTDKCVCG